MRIQILPYDSLFFLLKDTSGDRGTEIQGQLRITCVCHLSLLSASIRFLITDLRRYLARSMKLVPTRSVTLLLPALCRIPRASSVVIPARSSCYPGWTLEYSGYLMANEHGSVANMEYICVDASRRYLPDSQANSDGARLYYTVYECGSLACPPYTGGKLVLCAVCSK